MAGEASRSGQRTDPRSCGRTLRAIVMLALLVSITGCASTPPTQDPSIRGTITKAELTGGGIGTILIEGPLSGDTSFDRASVTVASDTEVFSADGSEVEAARLAEGQRVEAWFTGPVAESYPVQATAAAVKILD